MILKPSTVLKVRVSKLYHLDICIFNSSVASVSIVSYPESLVKTY